METADDAAPVSSLSALIEYWSNQTLAKVERWPDGGLVPEGLRVFEELPYTATRDVLLATGKRVFRKSPIATDGDVRSTPVWSANKGE